MSIESVLVTETSQSMVVMIAGGAGEKHKIKFHKLCTCFSMFLKLFFCKSDPDGGKECSIYWDKSSLVYVSMTSIELAPP